MYIKRHRINATLGAATGDFFSDYIHGGGFVEAIRLTSATSSGFSTGIGIAITAERSGLDILAVSNATQQTWYPQAQAQSTAGAGLSYTSAATPPIVPTKIPVANERVKISLSSGAEGQRGTFDLYISGF